MNRYAFPTFIRPTHKFELKAGLRMKNTRTEEEVILISRALAPSIATMPGRAAMYSTGKNMGWFVESKDGLTGDWISDMLLGIAYEPI